VFLLSYIVINIEVIPIITKDGDKILKTQTKNIFSDVNCLVIAWLFWMTYGVVFYPIYDLFGNLWVLIQTLILVFLVLLSYRPQIINNKWHTWSIIIVYTIVVLFFFSKDGISEALEDFVLVTKVVLFSILYMINDYKLKIPVNMMKNFGNDLSKKFKSNSQELPLQKEQNDDDDDDFDDEHFNIKEQTARFRFVALMRSYWVLSCSNRLIIFSLFQICIILVINYCNYANTQKQKPVIKDPKRENLMKRIQSASEEEDSVQSSDQDNGVSKRSKAKAKSPQVPLNEVKEKKKKQKKERKDNSIIPSMLSNVDPKVIEQLMRGNVAENV
jgi:hypothetical protein